ncbi:MAG: alpha/beta hydrolase family protein [bacterium]|nr:prolyl oligopeptidase family serine peptidase [Planctomycetaceae bacterium]
MKERTTMLPSALARCTRFARLGTTGVPALMAHPDWRTPCPTLIWMHGRTANKELDNGRYLRLLRVGIASVAIDLPGHGERLDTGLQSPERTLEMLATVRHELDEVVEELHGPHHGGVFDVERLAIGGMSAGGMAALRKLCEPHHVFTCGAVESTAGNLAMLYGDTPENPWPVHHSPQTVAPLDPLINMATWRVVPLLALHSAADRIVPLDCITTFVSALRTMYRDRGADADLVKIHTWATTGAPDEHSGFGRVAGEAKTLLVQFLVEKLRATPVDMFEA